MTAVAIAAMLVAVYCMIRAHRASADRDVMAAELDRAHAAGARLAVERAQLAEQIERRDLAIDALTARVAEVMRERDATLGIGEELPGSAAGRARIGRKR